MTRGTSKKGRKRDFGKKKKRKGAGSKSAGEGQNENKKDNELVSKKVGWEAANESYRGEVRDHKNDVGHLDRSGLRSGGRDSVKGKRANKIVEGKKIIAAMVVNLKQLPGEGSRN